MHKCFLDIETCGIHMHKTVVIEVGYLVVDDNNEVIGTRQYTVRPSTIYTPFEWTMQAENLHGISQQEAFAHEYTQEQFLQQISKDIKEDFEGKPNLYGFNVGYDYYFLKYMFDAYDIELPFGFRLKDINMMGDSLIGCDSSRRLAEKLEVDVDENKAHRALYDCYLGLDVYKKLSELSPAENFKKLEAIRDEYKNGEWDCKEELFEFMHKFFQSL